MPVRNLFIGLPAFNEEIALPRLLGKIAGLREASGLEITTLVYNDGSTDRTAEIARDWQARMPLVLLGTAANGGLGAGLRALVRHACDNGAPDDVLVVMDCDDSHDPSQIPQIIARLESGDDLVIASRFRRGASAVRVPALRHVTAYGAMILFKTIHPLRSVLDYTCGYRAYRVGLLQRGLQAFGPRWCRSPGSPAWRNCC
jgi:dolichol-phosphate mannosyltransferase